MNDIQQELMGFVSREFLNGNGAGLDIDTPLLELRILDSLTIVALYGFVEARFGVKLDGGPTSPVDFASIRALAQLIESRRAAA
jgi:acyl carrier protein